MVTGVVHYADDWTDCQDPAEEKWVPEGAMTDVRHRINSDQFEIDGIKKTFKITLTQLVKVVGSNTWPATARLDMGEKGLGAFHPKLSMISTETGKNATFFLAESADDYLLFRPSKGTVMHKKQLHGWTIVVSR